MTPHKVSFIPRSLASYDVLERSIIGITNTQNDLDRLAVASDL